MILFPVSEPRNRGPTIRACGLYRECACISAAYGLSAFGDCIFIPRLPASRGVCSSEPMVARVELVTSGTRTLSAALDTRYLIWLQNNCYIRRWDLNPHLTHLIVHDFPSASAYCMVSAILLIESTSEWSWWCDLNTQHLHYECNALPNWATSA